MTWSEDSSKFLTKIAPKTPRSQQKAEYERALEKHREDALQESKTGGGSPSPEGKAASPNLPPSGRKQPVPGKLTGERLVFNVKSAALKGNANAQYRMAIMFHHGKNGVKTDLSEAVRFYMLAAGSGEFGVGRREGDRGASDREYKVAYLKLAKRFHPDLFTCQRDVERMQQEIETMAYVQVSAFVSTPDSEMF